MKLRPELLLLPNIPKPIHGLNPRSIKGKEWWDDVRKRAQIDSDFHCVACGVSKYDAEWRQWLEGHEVYEYDYERGTAIFIEVVPLCFFCHNYIHSGRLSMLVSQGEIPVGLAEDIKKHGDGIITRAKLVRPAPPRIVAPWKEWVLILDEREYKSKFKSEDDWRRYYTR